jgi:DNA repair protein RadA
VGSIERADESLNRNASFRWLTTGAKLLDDLLGGGYREGTLTEVFGRSNSGKSQLAMQAALFAAMSGTRVLYVDTEGTFRPERLEQIALGRGVDVGGALEMVLTVRSDSAASQMETVRGMQSRSATASCKLVIIDTLTRNFSLELPGRTNLQSRQGALGIHLSEMARDAYINGRAYLLTNRVTFGPTSDVSIGGRTVEQLVRVSVQLEREPSGVRATVRGTGARASLGMGAAGVT